MKALLSLRCLFYLFAVIGLAAPVTASSKNAEHVFDRKPCIDLGFAATDFDTGVECGLVSVRESSSSKSRMIDLAVVVARAKNPDPKKEPVLYLHGGPGIATLDVMPRAMKGKSWPLFREDRDIIFFDQRGTGRSKPQICPEFDQIAAAQQSSATDSGAAFSKLVLAAHNCRRELAAKGAAVHAYGSTQIARDGDAVRRALGIKSWNIFATSFGSLPAAETIRYFPKTVSALFLDSAFSINSVNRAEQINATSSSFAAFQRRCSYEAVCAEQYPAIRALAAETIARLDKQPLSAQSFEIDGEKFMEAVWTLMVDGSTAPFVPTLLKRASDGDDAMIIRFVKVFANPDYFGGYSYAQAWLVNCHDIFPRPSAALKEKAIASNADIARGIVAAEQDQICDAIQPQAAPRNFYRPLRHNVPTLIMFGEFDPATPISDAKAAQEFFAKADLIEVEGASHAPFYTDGCTKSLVIRFFDNPTLHLNKDCLAQRPSFKFAGSDAFEAFLGELPK